MTHEKSKGVRIANVAATDADLNASFTRQDAEGLSRLDQHPGGARACEHAWQPHQSPRHSCAEVSQQCTPKGARWQQHIQFSAALLQDRASARRPGGRALLQCGRNGSSVLQIQMRMEV